MYKKMREWNEGDWDDLAVEIEELTEQQLELIVINDI